MNANEHDEFDQDGNLQDQAERAEREGLAAGRDPRVDRYRLIVRALRQPLEPQLPADFAARVARLAMRRDGDGFEDVMVSLLLLVMGLGALFFLGPVLVNAARTVVDVSLPPLPWRQAAMAAICIAAVWAMEHGWMRVQADSHRL